MDYQTQPSEENDPSDVNDPILSPFIRFNSVDDPVNHEKQSSWSHQKDLDDFFVRIYQYHQQHGFFTIVLSELFGLVQFIFIVSFTLLLVQCVDYPLLFRSSPEARNVTAKLQFNQVIRSPEQCLRKMPLLTSLCLLLSMIYWFYRLLRAMYNLFTYFNIRSFYAQALDIQPKELPNMTWHEIQQRLILAQRTHHLCIDKFDLTELDIHNRLLRFKNYEVGMVNKGILPIRIHLPFLGDIISFTAGFKFNLRLIFFGGPYAPFDERWHLREEYKDRSRREALAKQLSYFILLYGLANLVLSPFIFIWQVLNLFYGYTELVRREPGVLGSRRWSNYGRLYLRHFNELDHSLNQRLNRGYKPANGYMASFVNHSVTEIAKFISFTSGAILAVCLLLTVYDDDVLKVEHMLTLITSLGVVLGVCRSLIPDEHAVHDPEEMMQLVLAQVHYQPESWKNRAHKDYVQAEFAQMFQLKYVYFLEELLSPFVTPLILCIHLRRRSLQIIDFLRNYTISVQGVGDVCSFSQLDVAKNGNLKWFAPVQPKPSTKDPLITNDGKLELSLMHFHHTNPKWKMPRQSKGYLEKIQERVIDNMQTSVVLQRSLPQMQNLQIQRSVYSDLQASSSSSSEQNQSITTKSFDHTRRYPPLSSPPETSISLSMHQPSDRTSYIDASKADLPSRSLAPYGVLSTMHSQIFQLPNQHHPTDLSSPLEGLSGASQLDMNVSCLFMHELRHKYQHGDYENLEEIDEDNPH